MCEGVPKIITYAIVPICLIDKGGKDESATLIVRRSACERCNDDDNYSPNTPNQGSLIDWVQKSCSKYINSPSYNGKDDVDEENVPSECAEVSGSASLHSAR
jgi:hypothetical protein